MSRAEELANELIDESTYDLHHETIRRVTEAAAELRRLAAVEAELIAQLEEARAQMERQKDEWLSWEAKRRDLEKAAAELIALKKAIGDAEPVAWRWLENIEETGDGYWEFATAFSKPGPPDHVEPLYTLKGIK